MGRRDFLALNLAMAKAYDGVEWDFLAAIMTKMGFEKVFIKWIMICLSTASYSFNINGVAGGYVVPSRGIRQGDLISPYLFLMCSEGFSNMIKQAVGRGALTGVKISRQGPSITHLLFADDSLLFCKADPKHIKHVKEILEKYESSSEQKVNLEKSSIFFSKNTRTEVKKEICGILVGVRKQKCNKYLGLPLEIGKSKIQIFNFIIHQRGCQKENPKLDKRIFKSSW